MQSSRRVRGLTQMIQERDKSALAFHAMTRDAPWSGGFPAADEGISRSGCFPGHMGAMSASNNGRFALWFFRRLESRRSMTRLANVGRSGITETAARQAQESPLSVNTRIA